jgi:hypothetical protein
MRCGDSSNERGSLHGIVRNQGHLSLRRPYRDARDDPRTVPGLACEPPPAVRDRIGVSAAERFSAARISAPPLKSHRIGAAGSH